MLKRIPRSLTLAAACGFVAGVAWLVAVRYVTYKSDTVHYHANFALYINGQADQFKNFTFYEEVQSCGGSQLDNPKSRAHMHGNVNHVVHVHDHAVTWGQFFANLGYSLGNDLIRTNDGIYVDGQNDNKLSFILNGQPVGAVANKTIESEDVLLISYGRADDATLLKQYQAIPKDAPKVNQQNDPSSCSGTEPSSFRRRLWQAIGLFH